MSLRLRLLLLVGAINVGVLLLVVWLGLETARTLEPVGPAAIAEAVRVAEAEGDMASTQPWRTIRFALRLRRGTEEFEKVAPGDVRDEVREVEQRLFRRLTARDTGLSFDRHGVERVNPPDAEWRAYYVAFNDSAHWEALEGLRRIYILLCVGTVLLIAGTYLVLRRLVLQPLENLARASRAVAEGHPPAEVPRPHGKDEVSMLIDDFNRMALEVHEYQSHLEERVLQALGRAKAAEGRLVVAQRLASTGTLAAGFAHEINNPLGGVLNALRKLREGNLPPDKREEYYELAQDGLQRIRTIVERILHFTPRTREPARVDVADVCRRATDLARHRADRTGVSLEGVEGGAVAVAGDPQELTQAVLNLLLNAIDAIPAGRGGTVRVGARAEGGEAVVEVADDGVGMDEETVRRCVDLFFSTKPEGEGTGLGLAIVQHIVTDHGGTLEIVSRQGEGTTIRRHPPLAGG